MYPFIGVNTVEPVAAGIGQGFTGQAKQYGYDEQP